TAPTPRTKTQHALHTAREYFTHWVVGGLFILVTGLAPEHWLAHLVESLHMPEHLVHLWPGLFDIRAVLVLIGVALVSVGVWRRAALSKPVEQGAALVSATATQINRDVLVPLDKPSIAVLPFQNMSGDPEHAY